MTSNPELLDKARHIRLLAVDIDGTLTDGRVYYAEDGSSLVAFHTRDGYGIKQWQQLGLRFAALSGRHSAGVLRRMQTLGVSDTLLGVQEKRAPLQRLLDKHHLQPTQLCYIGDDHIDVPAMQLAGLAIAVADATAPCLAAADHQTRLAGGMGAVREVIDLLLQAQGLSLSMQHGASD